MIDGAQPPEIVDDGGVPAVPDVPESLRSKLWGALAPGGERVLKSKEMREACSFYDAIRKDARGLAPSLVLDVCGGHGALGMLCVAHGAAPRALIVDQHKPASHEALLTAWRPFVGDAVAYDERPLRQALPELLATHKDCGRILVVACHACQHLARDVVDACLVAQANFAVCPCCPKDVSGVGVQDASSMLGVDFGAAMVLAEMGRISGVAGSECDVRLRTFDVAISPHNRIVLGRFGTTGALARSGVVVEDAAEDRLRRAYERAHQRLPAAAAQQSCVKSAAGTPAALDPSLDYEGQLALKVTTVSEVFQSLLQDGRMDEALVAPPGLEIRRSPATHFRARTGVTLGEAGLFRLVPADAGFRLVSGDLSPETLAVPIARLLPLLGPLLAPGQGCESVVPGLAAIKFHATVGRRDAQQLFVCFIYGRDASTPDAVALEAARAAVADALQTAGVPVNVFAMAQARGVQVTAPEGRDFVDEELLVAGRTLLYRQPFGQFSNPNPYMAVHTAEWLLDAVRSSLSEGGPATDLLELYCGAGSHTVALAPLFRHVLAVEIQRRLVDAAQYNMKANGLDNVTVLRAPSEKFCRQVIRRRSYRLKAEDGRPEVELNFGCTIVDPPRAGLDDQTREAISGYDTVLYVSCNPEALRRDLAAFLPTHEVRGLVLLDHFPFSAHTEVGAHLRKRLGQ